jgi:pimeloyl-ACP methyl ester carboxylesterase
MDVLGIDAIKIIGLSGGGISALHMATLQPARVSAMVVVSAPAVFPEEARSIQRRFSLDMLGDRETARMRERHQRPGQLDALCAQVRAMADGGDPNFISADLARVKARTLVVFGDQDFLYPASMGAELAGAIPGASLWLIAGGSHGPIFGDRAPEFARRALRFLARE